MRTTALAFLAALALAGPAAAAPPAPPPAADLAAQAEAVRATEAAFARTMADRDFAAFARFVAPDAVFVEEPSLRGAEAVLAGWKPLFDGATAPFSWAPEAVDVLPSGGLAMSHGPVFNARGERTGTFWSVWRLEPDGRWRIVLDHGCSGCPCAGKP